MKHIIKNIGKNASTGKSTTIAGSITGIVATIAYVWALFNPENETAKMLMQNAVPIGVSVAVGVAALIALFGQAKNIFKKEK